MDLSTQKIVIVGGGIGGLTAALALAMRGADVTVLEQAQAITEVGAGIQVSPNGFRVLNALGLGDGIAAQSVKGRAICLRDYRRGDQVLRLNLAEMPDGAGYYFVHRADLIDLLAEHVRVRGGKIRLLQKVCAVTHGAKPRVALCNGDALAADLVIAADGLHSVTRAQLNGADAPFFTGQTAWRAIVPNVQGHPMHARLHMGPGRHFVSYPLRDGSMVNLVAVQERDLWVEEGWNHADDPDNLRAAFADFCPEVHQLLAGVTEVRLWGLHRHPVAKTWVGEGLALLGDAAHPTLPFLAQGANMALEDAWVLADCLARGTDQRAALQSYQDKRQARVRRVVNAASSNARKYHLRHGPHRWVAHLGLKAIGAVAPGMPLRGFRWLYDHDVTAG